MRRRRLFSSRFNQRMQLYPLQIRIIPLLPSLDTLELELQSFPETSPVTLILFPSFCFPLCHRSLFFFYLSVSHPCNLHCSLQSFRAPPPSPFLPPLTVVPPVKGRMPKRNGLLSTQLSWRAQQCLRNSSWVGTTGKTSFVERRGGGGEAHKVLKSNCPPLPCYHWSM